MLDGVKRSNFNHFRMNSDSKVLRRDAVCSSSSGLTFYDLHQLAEEQSLEENMQRGIEEFRRHSLQSE